MILEEKKSVLIVSNSASRQVAGGLNVTSPFTQEVFEKEYQTSQIYIKDNKKFLRLLQLIRIIHKLSSKDYHFVYFNSIYYPEFIFISIVCNIFSVKYCVHSHGSLSRFAFLERSFKKELLRSILRWCVEKADLVVYSSSEESSSSAVSAKKVSYVSNFISHSDNKFIERQRNLKKIVFISKIDWKYKGIRQMINGFEQFNHSHSGYELHIYGYGEEKVDANIINTSDPLIKTLVDLIDGKENIFYHGPVYGEKKLEIIRGCGALCLFSRSEAMPLILTEAISQGTVVLFSASTNYQSILNDDELLCDGSEESIREIFAIYANKITPNYFQYSRKNRETFLEKFCEDKRLEEQRKLRADVRKIISKNENCC